MAAPGADLDPLHACDSIVDGYRRYLRSTFAPRDHQLSAELDRRLAEPGRLAKGPFLQAAPPYETGARLTDLVDEGVLSEQFRHLPVAAFPPDRALYVHQEQAIRKIIDGRNLIIATGTGSGKTESFLLPILQHLFAEADTGTLNAPGVRALLLYPMNALANDQMKRLRELLAPYPDITFGRYVGDTKHERAQGLEHHKAKFGHEPLPNELVSRAEMQDRPPHILITNFAMLEYLLLRPGDSSLFDGPTGRHWAFVVLDEVHVYDGAKGAEVGMLLRRVRDRVLASERGRLRCVGTSATLGSGDEDLPRLAAFGEALFDEVVDWHVSDPSRQDIVLPRRRPLAADTPGARLPPECFETLADARRTGADALVMAAALESHGVSLPAVADEDVPRWLGRLLHDEAHLHQVQTRLEHGSAEVLDIAEDVFGGPGAAHALVALIELAIHARHEPSGAPLLPARYHLLIRALEGAFLCRHRSHPDGVSRLVLARHEQCPACARIGVSSLMFEVGACRRCGAEYLVGRQDDDGYFKQVAPHVLEPEHLLLAATDSAAEDEDESSLDDADEAALGEATVDLDARTLCASCGTLVPGGELGGCCGSAEPIAVVRAHPAKGATILRRCAECGGRSNGPIVYRVLTGADAPASVLATELYQAIPPAIGPGSSQVGQGRKLLTFSDSRQDAAFFAPYLDRTYSRAVERRLLWTAIQAADDDRPRFGDLATPIRKMAERARVLDEDDSAATNRARVATWLMREVLAIDPRQSIDGVGLAEITPALRADIDIPTPLSDLGLDDQGVIDLLRMLLRTVREAAAVDVPDEVDILDPIFAPRNTTTVLRGGQSERGVLAWSPTKGSNRRLDIVTKVLSRASSDRPPADVLADFWTWLTHPDGPFTKTLVKRDHKRAGTVWALDPDRMEFIRASDDTVLYRCDTCRQLTWRSVLAVCPSFRCAGRLVPARRADLPTDHYRNLYTDLRPIGMRVEEHTGQLESNYAGELAQQFIDGKVNVLSCTTTFELGVDVGEVQSVLLRNVPPTPANYVQRAGRAGRRAGAAALVVTFAQRRNHDLHYFSEPSTLIDGVVAPPIISTTNAAIIRRHLHAVAFAAFERHVVDTGGAWHRKVEAFFAPPEDSACDQFVSWLRSRPPSLEAALVRLTPPTLDAALGVSDWSWVERLVNDPEEIGQGWLGRAAAETMGDLLEVREQIDKAAAEEKFAYAGVLQRLFRTLAERPLLDYLAQRGVLPKYGFPVDVVQLDVSRAGDPIAARLDLSRDLKLGIVDYAPGSRIVAAKALWESTGLRRPPGKGLLFKRFSRCNECNAFDSWLGSRQGGCKVCGNTSGQAVDGRSFVIPIFGFIGAKSKDKPGEARPPKAGYAESNFDDYAGSTPEPELVVVGPDGAGLVEVRKSRQGRITVINRGSGGRGFQICPDCGYAASGGSTRPKKGETEPPPHSRPNRPDSTCSTYLRYATLGHQYLTDVVELRLPNTSGMSWEAAPSVLAALLAATRSIGVTPDDLDGSLRVYGVGAAPALVLFDAVPGGAGHALHAATRLKDLIRGAYDVVAGCECGEETSCYGCLRSYRNQPLHEHLARGDASAVLAAVLGLSMHATPAPPS